MPVAKRKTMSPHPPTKSTGKKTPTGTTHFQFRPNQFGGGKGAASISETEASRPHLKSEPVSQLHNSRRDPSTYARDDAVAGVYQLPRQRLLGVGKSVSGNRNHRRILLQFVRNNFVQRVGRSVMIIKIKAAVLHRAECRDAGFFHRLGVRADVLR